MSSQIYYSMLIARIPCDAVKAEVDQFIQLTLDGANNTYVGDVRAREWHLQSFGTAEEIIAGAIAHSASFDGTMSYWKSKGKSGVLSAQQWIRKVKNAINSASVWLPELYPLSDNAFGTLQLRGVGELAGADIKEIIHFLYQYSKRNSVEQKEWPTYWNYVQVSGRGSV